MILAISPLQNNYPPLVRVSTNTFKTFRVKKGEYEIFTS